jgi:hypothetical protein
MAAMAFPSLELMLKLLTIILTLCPLVFCDSVSVNGRGTTLYRGTPVQTLPYGMPTLTYNCAKMPSICENVAQREQMNDDYSLVNDPVLLHFDKSGSRKKTRRRQSCPANWHDKHECPETDQPPVVVSGGYVDADMIPQGGAFEGQATTDPNYPAPTGVLRHMIADENDDFRGIYWSCDEWPAAS